MRGSFIAQAHENEQSYLKIAYQTDYVRPFVPFNHRPRQTREYPFLKQDPLTMDMDTVGLVEHDMEDEERMPVKLELNPDLLNMIVENVNDVFETDSLSEKVDLTKLVHGRIEAVARQLKPELIKEEAGVTAAAEILDYEFRQRQVRIARSMGVEISDIARVDHSDPMPGTILNQRFKEWSSGEWAEAREVATDLLLTYIDPRFTTEFAMYADRDVELADGPDEQNESSESAGLQRIRNMGKNVLRRLVNIGV